MHYSSSSGRDYYSILGVPSTATQREIKSAYYTLSKKFHPDVAGSSAESKFIEIGEAYECLRDPNRRRAYDNIKNGASGPRYTGDHGYQGDPFKEFYERASQQQWHYHQHGRSRRYNQADYERIWEEFRRMSEKERSARANGDQQRIWEELARRRAERWRAFSTRYPTGPPGSIKWEWTFRSSDSHNPSRQSMLVRRILLVYISVFCVITTVQVLLQSLGDIFGSSTQRKPKDSVIGYSPADRDRLISMMETVPGIERGTEHDRRHVVSDSSLHSNDWASTVTDQQNRAGDDLEGTPSSYPYGLPSSLPRT